MMKTKLDAIHGLTADMTSALHDANVMTVSDLIQAKPHLPELAAETGIDLPVLQRAADRAELLQISGVGTIEILILETLGIVSISELAKACPQTLHKQFEELNQREQLVRQPISLDAWEDWVRQASIHTCR